MAHPAVRRIRFAVAIALFAALTLGGCASAPDPRTAGAGFEQVNDPIEPLNRVIFAFNEAFDRAILRPLATLYRDFVPQAIQDAVGNVLANLRAPVVLANDILQGEGRRAGNTLARFAVNTTVGVGGIADVAAEMGIARHAEDFGQTLAVWGVGEGPYLVLPVLGPSNPRDAIGRAADFLADPLHWWAGNADHEWFVYSRTGITAIDGRSRHMKALDEMERSSLDYYAAIRSLYRQRREDEIRNGRGAPDAPSPGLSGVGNAAIRMSEAEPPQPLHDRN